VTNRDISWADLQRQQQENLQNFLDVELDLSLTFCELAKNHRNPERRAELHRKIQDAIDTIQHFAGRIQDSSIRKDILDRPKDLECRATDK